MDAATELFAERGYRDTTFADIAERAGVSRGSIPWYFNDKPGLLAAVLSDFSESLFRSFDEEHRASGDDLLTFMIRRLARTLREPTSGLFITLLLETARPPASRPLPDLHALLDRQFASIGARLPLRAGVTPQDFAFVVRSYATGAHQAWRARPDQVDMAHALDLLQAMIEGSLLER